MSTASETYELSAAYFSACFVWEALLDNVQEH